MSLEHPNVLSLFDGISCGRVALERLGITPANYFASEIDKFAIKCTQANYPDTIQLGDVRNVGKALLKDYDIDILFAGFSCQSFSMAGQQKGFEDDRSKLFFEFVRILEEIKPTYFLLENVRMKKEWQDVISSYVGVEPVLINSSLVSAQNRQRLYWTNIPGVEQPEDKKIVLRDILECVCNGGEKSCADGDFKTGKIKEFTCEGWAYNRKDGLKYPIEKSYSLNASDYRGLNRNQTQTAVVSGCQRVATADLKGHDSIKRVYSPDGKCPSLTTCQGGHREPKIVCCAKADVDSNYETDQRVYDTSSKSPTLQASRNRSEGIIKIECCEKLSKFCLSVEKISKLDLKKFYNHPIPVMFTEQRTEESKQIRKEYQKQKRDYSPRRGKELVPRKDSKSNCLTTSMSKEHILLDLVNQYRKLTPLECERLQTMPDGYTAMLSNTQRYKTLGNGWTVDVIAHILSYLYNYRNKKIT